MCVLLLFFKKQNILLLFSPLSFLFLFFYCYLVSVSIILKFLFFDFKQNKRKFDLILMKVFLTAILQFLESVSFKFDNSTTTTTTTKERNLVLTLLVFFNAPNNTNFTSSLFFLFYSLHRPPRHLQTSHLSPRPLRPTLGSPPLQSQALG